MVRCSNSIGLQACAKSHKLVFFYSVFFLSATGKSCAFITRAQTMRTGSNLPNAESSRFPPAQQIGTPISEICAVHLHYWQQSSSSPSFLLSSPCLNGGGPSAGCNQSSGWRTRVWQERTRCRNRDKIVIKHQSERSSEDEGAHRFEHRTHRT